MNYNITASLVLFKTDIEEIENVLEILKQSKLNLKIILVDNSPTRILEKQIPVNQNLEYIFSGSNLGFGTAHNVAIAKSIKDSEFHLVLNADVDFEADILEEIYAYMKKHQDVGILGPKIHNPDGSHQYSAKLLPTPANLIVRRFVPIKSLQENMDFEYEFKFFNFDRIIEVPYLTGCFMFMNCKALKEVGGFDERYFMYPEDTDLTRRIHQFSKAIYYPHVSIVHEHGKGSYKSKKLLYYHVTSMIKYFNKWGWFFDKGRAEMNKRALAQFK